MQSWRKEQAAPELDVKCGFKQQTRQVRRKEQLLRQMASVNKFGTPYLKPNSTSATL